MKKTILLFMALILFGCSNDSSNELEKNIPEKFEIRVETKINGGSSPKVYIAINSLIVKQWSYVNFPFDDSYIYYTTGNETKNNSCKCIEITAGTYISSVLKLESFNLYVNGKLVDKTSIASPPTSDGIMTTTSVKYIYKP